MVWLIMATNTIDLFNFLEILVLEIIRTTDSILTGKSLSRKG